MIFAWGDDEYEFALYGAQIEELQIKCGNVGFGAIFQRVTLGQWFWCDIYHTVRLGLIGGGMEAIAAKRLVEKYIGQNRIDVAIIGEINSPEEITKALLGGVMFGLKDLPPGKQTVEMKKGS